MVWAKAGTTTLTSSGDEIDISMTTSSKFNMILVHQLETGSSINSSYRVGNSTVDTGSNYSRRTSNNGGADSTNDSMDKLSSFYGSIDDSGFAVGYFVNIATEEKLFIVHGTGNDATGAGTAPERREFVGKWSNTSDLIDTCRVFNEQNGSYDTDSNHTVIGSDGTESLNVQDGAIYYDTTLNKEYVLYNNTWTEV